MDDNKQKPIKSIFISSPSDTRQERLKAQTVIEKLAREFSHYFSVVPVLWEREPLTANQHFQADLKPREADIVVVILWSRLGTFLPLDEYPGPISGRQVTGTEWEFEDAFAAYQKNQKPDILVYRKNAEVMEDLKNDEVLEQKRQQYRALEEFIYEWFVDKKENIFKLAFREFTSTTEFEDMLETHLRKLLDDQLDEDKKVDIHWHKGSPYRGLESFELEHASVFFGRRRARNELLELLVKRIGSGCAFVVVFGASGCGKSSLIKSGLLADLKLPGMIGNVALCRHAIFRPSDDPNNLLQGLAKALLSVEALPELSGLGYDTNTLAEQLQGTVNQVSLPIRQALDAATKNSGLTDRAEARLLLIVDQMEELFTIDGLTLDQRRSFVATLDALAHSGWVWVIATMRSDFCERLDQLPNLFDLAVSEARYHLTFPNETEINQIIRLPAREAGLHFEYNNKLGYDLADELCKAASQAPSSLPLLEFTLDQLWQRRSENGELTFNAYQELGGLEGALGRRAEEEFLKLPPEVQAALPQVLRALSNVDQGLDIKVTARAVSFSALPASNPVPRLVEAFLNPHSRLLVSEGDEKSGRVRVSHEALLTHWERARNQLKHDRADLQVRSRLEQAAALYYAADEIKRVERLLPSGLPLEEGLDLLNRRRSELDETVISFIEASFSAIQEQKKRNRRRIITTISVVSTLAVLAIILAFMFYQQKQKADQERNIALSGELAAQAALLADHATDDRMIERAAALAIESWKLNHNAEASNITSKLLRMLPNYRIEHQGLVMSIDISPDGSLLATGGKDKRVRVIDTHTGKELFHIDQGDWIFSVAFSPDGKFLATGSKDKTTRLIDIASRNEDYRLAHDSEVRKVLFSKDGRLLAAINGSQALLVDGANGRDLLQVKHGDEVLGIAFSPDSRLLATAGRDNKTRVIQITSGREKAVIKHESEVNNVIFSDDGRYLATASKDGTARLIDVASGNEVRRINHNDGVWSISFSPDNLWLATGSDDNTARVTNISTGVTLAQFSHKKGVFGVRFSPDGKLFATASMDGTAHLIDTETWQEITAIVHGGAVWKIAFSPDSHQLATASSDNTVRLVETFKYPEDMKIKHAGAIMGIAFDPKGQLLATASQDKTAKLFDLSTGNELMTINHNDIVYGVSVSWDGRFLATSSKDKTAKLINIATGEQITTIPHQGEVRMVTFSPDSLTMATGSMDAKVRLIDTATGRVTNEIKNSDEISSVVFSFDDRLLAIACKDGSLKLTDKKTGQRKSLIKLSAAIYQIAFSPDGRYLAVAGEDKAARLIEIATGKESAKFEHPEAVLQVAFSPGGRLLATGSKDNSVRLIEINSGELKSLIKHGGEITAIAFRPDGKILATGSRDGTTRLVETASGLEVARMGYDDEVWAVAFSLDGQLLASGVSDGRLQLREADVQKGFDRLCAKAGRNLNKEELHDYLGGSSSHKTCANWRSSVEDVGAAR